MRGVCGIDIDKDRMFISFAASHHQRLKFFGETYIDLPFKEDNLLAYLKRNSEIINQKIIREEKVLSLKVDKVFCNLPPEMENRKMVEEVIPFKKRKKIIPRDLSFAKKYLTDIFLDWDDYCVHHFVLDYEVEGNNYKQPPLGIKAKKVKLKSHLVWVKDKLCREVEDIINNLDREFGGFVSFDASVLAASLPPGPVVKLLAEEQRRGSVICVINIGYEQSYCVVYQEGRLAGGETFAFGLNKIIQALAKRFLLPFGLAQEVFYRYVSFKSMPYFKEVSIKNGNSYVSLSIQSLNSFTKDYIRSELGPILERLIEKVGKDKAVVSFIGRLNVKEGFSALLKEFVPAEVRVHSWGREVSSSFGCVRYGIQRFLENDDHPRVPLLQRVLKVYKEYF